MSGKNKAVRYSAKKRNEAWWGYLMVLPTILGLIVLNIIPIFQTIYQIFFKTGDFGKGNIFIGLENYITLIHDSSVWQAVWNTIRYTIVEVPISIVIALLLAVLLNRKMKCRVAFRTIYFLPMIAAPAAVAMVWRWLYNSQFGLLNHLLSLFGLGPVNWISDPNIAIYSVAVVGIWSVIGYNMVLFLAGLQEVPKDYYEAARIDGANAVQQFFNVTIPLLSPTLFFVLVTRLIAAMQVFDVIYMMMDLSNPALEETQSLVYLFYNYSFVEGNKGYGSTIVILLLMIIMVITLFQNYLEKKWVHYN